jgi:molecular chaperone HtpG
MAKAAEATPVAGAQAETLTFQAEVSRLLDIVANALYSNQEVFLRELVSNASDACDRLRYEALTKPDLLGEDSEFRITITPDAKRRALAISDNGIGMSREEMVQNLGTIARSGTAAYMAALDGPGGKDGKKKGEAGLSLIGEFGVGFYSAFMVADQVSVVSRRAGEDAAWQWTSDGKGGFEVAPAERESRGTTVTLKLRAAAKEFTDPQRLRRVVHTYSDHIAVPIALADGDKTETINTASALWTRPASEIGEDQYKEFYHHVAHSFDDPWLVLHNRVEGKIEYTSLLFVPSHKPFDLFDPDRKPQLRLYVRRVFITDECEALVPPYLRFLRGIVDSEDLPLNISREMLQTTPVLAKIRAGIVRRVLRELAKKAEKEPESYAAFWQQFGAVLKEGLYEDAERREELFKLVRFRTTAGEDPVSLADYVGRMQPGQDAIYYITGDDAEAIARSPHLEGFAARGIEVLLLSDPVDDFWIPHVREYDGKPFRSVTQGAADLEQIEKPEGQDAEAAKAEDDTAPTDRLIAFVKLALQDQVKDVRASQRLTDSPVCLVADEGDLDMHVERLLRQHKQLDSAAMRILEINAKHPLIRCLADMVGRDGADQTLRDLAQLLLDQARIIEGETLSDPAAFSRRLSQVLVSGLSARAGD